MMEYIEVMLIRFEAKLLSKGGRFKKEYLKTNIQCCRLPHPCFVKTIFG